MQIVEYIPYLTPQILNAPSVGLPDHLFNECEQKAKFATCEVTGLAIRVNEFDSWSKR